MLGVLESFRHLEILDTQAGYSRHMEVSYLLNHVSDSVIRQ